MLLAMMVMPLLGLPAAGATPSPSAVTASAATVSGVRKSEVLGYSRQHRPIVAYQLGNPAAPFKALVVGSMHGYYERAGEQVVAAIMKLPISTSVDLWVIPTMNPDGDALGQRGNANGVDLNRNFPTGWTYIPPSDDTFDSHYSGPNALSEPESRAMYTFLNRLRPNRMVSMHQPLVAVDTTDGGARDIPFRNALAANLGLPTSPLTCFSTCHGSMTRWVTATQSGAAITVEFAQVESSAYLTGQAATGILAALLIGVKPPSLPHVLGSLDVVRTSPYVVSVVGWVVDPRNTPAAAWASVTIDGRTSGVVIASSSRPDVDRALRVTGRHGFVLSIRTSPGTHRVCVTGNATRGTSSLATSLGCRAVTVPPYSFRGRVDNVSVRPRAIHVAGWALDPLHLAASSRIRISIDGRAAVEFTTAVLRSDVNRSTGSTGRHGFDVTVPVPAGRHTVSVSPLPVGTPTIATVLPGGSAVVTVPAK